MSPISPISPMSPIRLIGPMSPMSLIGLISLISLIGLMSCSSEQPEPEPQAPQDETAISFGGGVADEQTVTRSTGLEEFATTFHVWAYKNTGYEAPAYTTYQTVINNYEVQWAANTSSTTTSNTHDWEYVGIGEQTIKYWDWSAKAYRFFGVTGATPTAYTAYEPHVTSGSYKSQNLTLNADATDVDATPYYSRLWISDGNEVHYPVRPFGQAVQLEFLKPLARVRLLFSFSPDLDYTVEDDLSDVTFLPTDEDTYIAKRGTVTITYPITGPETDDEETWATAPADPGGYFPRMGAGMILTENDTWYYVLPYRNDDTFTLTCKVRNVLKTAVVPQEYMTWLPGYEYTYRFKVIDHDGDISFDRVEVAISDWKVKDTVDHPVFNW